MPPIRPHDNPPAQTGKNRPRVPRHVCAHNLTHTPHFLHGHLRQSEHRARKDVDDDLLVDAALDAATEDGVAAYESRQEGVGGGFFTRRRGGAQ